jgi:hypothetical protein
VPVRKESEAAPLDAGIRGYMENPVTEERPPAGQNGGSSTEPARGNPITEGDDPDNVVDPDDSGPRLSVTLKESPVDEIYALPSAQAEQITGPYPSTTDQSKAPQSPPKATAEAAGVPVPPDLLDPAVLRTMPAKVAAFMMYEPPDRPPWRAETPAQRAHREAIEDCGSWVGK